MSKDKKILDLGCGVGGWLNLLEQCGFMNVQGWDISSLAAPVAEILWRHTLHIENHEVSGALSNASEELISTFALITAFDFVEHVWHDQTLLQGIHGLLSPGGQLVIEVPIVPINASTSDLADYDLLYPEHHLHLYSYSGIRANAEQSGFHVDTGFVISNSNKALLILGK